MIKFKKLIFQKYDKRRGLLYSSVSYTQNLNVKCIESYEVIRKRDFEHNKLQDVIKVNLASGQYHYFLGDLNSFLNEVQN